MPVGVLPCDIFSMGAAAAAGGLPRDIFSMGAAAAAGADKGTIRLDNINGILFLKRLLSYKT